MSKKLIRTKDLERGAPPIRPEIRHIVRYVHRATGEVGSKVYCTFCLDAAVWLFMQSHDPTQYMVLRVYKDNHCTGVEYYNAIGTQRQIEALQKKGALFPDEAAELERLTDKIKHNYYSRRCLDFEHEFTWIEEEMI